MTKNDGGPAFPSAQITSWRVGGHGGSEAAPHYEMVGGMSLRDWFAGQALMGILALPGTIRGQQNKSGIDCAAEAYIFADAMLAERAK